MKPFKRGKLTFVLLLLVVFHPGCGTIYTVVNEYEGVQHGLVMSGIRFDCRGAFEYGSVQFTTVKVNSYRISSLRILKPGDFGLTAPFASITGSKNEP